MLCLAIAAQRADAGGIRVGAVGLRGVRLHTNVEIDAEGQLNAADKVKLVLFVAI